MKLISHCGQFPRISSIYKHPQDHQQFPSKQVNDNGDVIMSKSYMHYATLSFLYEFVNLSKYNLF